MTPNGFRVSDTTFRFALSDVIGAFNGHGRTPPRAARVARKRWIAEWKQHSHPISGQTVKTVVRRLLVLRPMRLGVLMRRRLAG
jgi:hypothetical protein